MTASLSAEIVAALAEAGDRYPSVEQVHISSLALNFSSTGVQTSPSAPSAAYRLTSEDSKWVVTIAADAFSLETPRYGRWEDDFREHFLRLLEVIARLAAPTVAARVGLRYVDVLTGDPSDESPLAWKGRIRSEFLGALEDPAFAPCVRLSQQQINLRIPDELNAVLRHGVFIDSNAVPAMRYLIDTDVYREKFTQFDASDISRVLDTMHLESAKLFQFVITPEYYEHLRKPT